MNGSLPTPRRRTERRHQEGQGMVEYSLILVLIAVVAAVMLLVVGQTTNTLFSNVSHVLGT